MIEYKTIRAPQEPETIETAIGLLTEAFGPEEGALERRQLSGREARDNTDILFTAQEDGRLLSMLHLTVSRAHPGFACLGGMITVPAARGRGLADRLFTMACAHYDETDGGALFLGTNNPAAARLYARHGFSFLTGTNVMPRLPSGSMFDFYRTAYAPDALTHRPAGDFCRVPLIPLACARGRDVLMDANANLVSSACATQVSCTGLYPRLLRIAETGGVWCAELPTGALAALSTARKRPDGRTQVDAFAYPGFEHALPGLLETACAGRTDLCARVAVCDTEKQALFASLGFRPGAACTHVQNDFLHIPCTEYVR